MPSATGSAEVAAEDVAQQVLATVGLWWPDADEDRLRAAAAAWDRMAARLDAAVPAGRGVVAGAGTWSGDAAAAFREAWARHEGALTTDAAGCRQVAGGLRAYADAVADAKRRVTEIAVTVGATLVVGTALAVVTFGVAEAAAAGVSAGLVAAAAAIGVELSSTVAAITAGALTGVVFGAVEGVAVDAMVAQPIRVEGFGDGGYSVGELRDATVWGGAGGAVVAGAGVAARSLRGLDTTLHPPATPPARAEPAAPVRPRTPAPEPPPPVPSPPTPPTATPPALAIARPATAPGPAPSPPGPRPPASAPSVADVKLDNIVQRLYRNTTATNRTGDGTTGDAVRHERATGEAVKDKRHIQKANETVRALRHWLRRHPDASPADRRIAQAELDNLLDALGRT